MPELIPRFGGHPLRYLAEPCVERFGEVIMKTLHLIIGLKAIPFKQALVIWMIIGYLERGVCESVNQQSPVFVGLPEVLRSVHRLHPLCAEPLPGSVKEHPGGPVVIDTFKESDSPGRLVIGMGQVIVDEGRDASDEAPLFAGEHPPRCCSVLVIRIFLRIEYSPDMVIERTYPCIVIPVNDPGGVKEHFFRFPVGDLDQLHINVIKCRIDYLL